MTTTDYANGVKTTAAKPMNSVRTVARTELARRSSAAIDVALLWERNDSVDTVLVRVRDRETCANLEIAAEPHRALEVYHHPVAYRDRARRQRAATDPGRPEESRRGGWRSRGGSVRGGAE
jgi:hypothetical protein